MEIINNSTLFLSSQLSYLVILPKIAAPGVKLYLILIVFFVF